jgi:hypothetical protein
MCALKFPTAPLILPSISCPEIFPDCRLSRCRVFKRLIDVRKHSGHHLIVHVLHHQGVGEIVDVLGSAGKMQKLGFGRQFRQFGELFLEIVLDGLDVVVGDGFDFLHPFRGRLIESGDKPVEEVIGFRAGRGQFRNSGVGRQRLEPAYFHDHPAVDQAKLAAHRTQGFSAAGIAAVDG